MAKDLSKLKERALQLVEKEKYGKAVEVYGELAAAEPTNPRWYQKLGELHRKLGQPALAIAAFGEAAKRLAQAGFLVKAIALCKVILELSPEHVETQTYLAELYAAQSPARAPAVAAASLSAEPTPSPAGRATRRTIPPGASLDAVVLKNVLPDAQPQPSSFAAVPSGLYRISLGEEGVQVTRMTAEPGTTSPALPPALPAIPLFSSLDAGALRSLIERVEVREYASGARIITQGEESDTLYVLVEGAAAVYREGPPRQEMSRLEEGAFFGEIALLTQTPRVATVETLMPVVVLAISRSVISDLVEDHPAVLQVMLRFFRDRLIQTLAQTSALFAPFMDEERVSLVGRFDFLEAEAGSEVLRQGHHADGLYLVLCGSLAVGEGSGGASPANLGPGSLVGEISLLTSTPSAVTVSCASKCWFLKLARAAFQDVIMTHPQVLAFLSQLIDERQAQAAGVAQGAPYAEQTIPLL